MAYSVVPRSAACEGERKMSDITQTLPTSTPRRPSKGRTDLVIGLGLLALAVAAPFFIESR